MFFFLLISSIYSVILPPVFLLNFYNNQKKPASTLKVVLETNYNDISFKETLVYYAPNSYRILIEKDEDSILFIRQANACIGITKNTKIDISCSNYLDNFFYNVFLYSNNYLNYLKKIGIEFDINNTEFKFEEKASIKDTNINLVLFEETPIYIIGASDDTYNKIKLNIKNSKNINAEIINEIKYLMPQVWIDKNTMYPSRYFASINNKKTEVLFKHFNILENSFVYPRLLEFYDANVNYLTYKVLEVEPKIKINEKLLDVEDYKKRFTKLADINSFSNNKKILLQYLTATR